MRMMMLHEHAINNSSHELAIKAYDHACHVATCICVPPSRSALLLCLWSYR